METLDSPVARHPRLTWVLPAVLGTVALVCAIVWRLMQEPGSYPPWSAPHRIPWALASWLFALLGLPLALVNSLVAPAGARAKSLLLGAVPSVVTAALWKSF